ncbi:MAG TPA: hypothetical protein VM120_17425 [Bryobacteraceae bacterium]|nr:hypothetical protein [Bryobacteraceae bacterium]
MKTKLRSILSITLLAAAFALAAPAMPMQASAASKTQAKHQAKASHPTPDAIADAKARNLVWVNTASGVYHKGGEFYGKTSRGSFMTEEEAKKAGHRLAKEPLLKKKPAVKTK